MTGSRVTKKRPTKSKAAPTGGARGVRGVAGGLSQPMRVAIGPKAAGTDDSTTVTVDVELLETTDSRLAGYGIVRIDDPASDYYMSGGGWVLVAILTSGDEAAVDAGPVSDWRAVVGIAYLVERLVPNYPAKANAGTVTQNELRQINDTLSKRPEEDLLVEYEIGRSVPSSWSRVDAKWRPAWRNELEKETGSIEAVFEVPGNAAWASFRWAASGKEGFSDEEFPRDVVVLGVRSKKPDQRWVPVVQVDIPDPEGTSPVPELSSQGPRSQQWTDLPGFDDPRRAGAYGWTWARLWKLVDPSLDLQTLSEIARTQGPIPAGDELPVRVSMTRREDPLVPFSAVATAVARVIPRDPTTLDRLVGSVFVQDGRPVPPTPLGSGDYESWLRHKLDQVDHLLYGKIRADAAKDQADAKRRAQEQRERDQRVSTRQRSTPQQPLGPDDVRAFVPDVGTAIARHDATSDTWHTHDQRPSSSGPSQRPEARSQRLVTKGWKPRSIDVARAAFLGWTTAQIEAAAAREVEIQHGARTERQQERVKQQERGRHQQAASRPGPDDVSFVNQAGERVIARHDPVTNAWSVPFHDDFHDYTIVVSVGWKPARRDVERAVSFGWTTAQIEEAAVREQQARHQKVRQQDLAAAEQQKKRTRYSLLERLMYGSSR